MKPSNKLLDWQGAPIILGRGKTHVVTYADILRDLEPLNEGRDKKDRITYDCLWVHAKRHYDKAAITAHWPARMHKELMNALGGQRGVGPWRSSSTRRQRRVHLHAKPFSSGDPTGRGNSSYLTPTTRVAPNSR